ncbi:hypothetical protein GH714_003463 [Hevea brasiliensis]|uniref:Uncharacterized protein n=1 Tax=Hevea brasiliensis TaxID=3981 RepID=A0A6A6K488_HEVBR|nr:hypothetical protein GH714_003463 [Hevea brasiliensis]
MNTRFKMKEGLGIDTIYLMLLVLRFCCRGGAGRCCLIIQFEMMSTNSSTSQKDKKRNFRPKRGQIKAQIFQSLTKTVSSWVTKAGEALKRDRGHGADGGISSSTAATSPFSTYNSDG